MATMLLRIPDLDPADIDRVEALLRSMPGVFGVVVSASAGCAEMDIEDDEVDIDDVLDRMRAEGFTARLSG
jgi:copper chaperone CopZ